MTDVKDIKQFLKRWDRYIKPWPEVTIIQGPITCQVTRATIFAFPCSNGLGWLVVRLEVRWWVKLFGMRRNIEKKIRDDLRAIVPVGLNVEFRTK